MYKYISFICCYVLETKNSILSVIQEYHRNMNNATNSEERSLFHLIGTSMYWLKYIARTEVEVIPPNLCASMLMFQGQDINEVSTYTTYNLWKKEEKLFPVLEKFLKFIWRYSSSMIKDIKEEVKKESMKISEFSPTF